MQLESNLKVMDNYLNKLLLSPTSRASKVNSKTGFIKDFFEELAVRCTMIEAPLPTHMRCNYCEYGDDVSLIMGWHIAPDQYNKCHVRIELDNLTFKYPTINGKTKEIRPSSKLDVINVAQEVAEFSKMRMS